VPFFIPYLITEDRVKDIAPSIIARYKAITVTTINTDI
jgi:hypothetical protein